MRPVRLALGVLLAVGLVLAGVVPWLTVAKREAVTVTLLNPVAGQHLERQKGDTVQIHGLVAGIKRNSSITLRVGGEEVWSGRFQEGDEAPPVPAVRWRAEAPGQYEVTLEVVPPDGEPIRAEPGFIVVSS